MGFRRVAKEADIERALFEISNYRARLEQTARETSKIAQEAFQKCVSAQAEKNVRLATIYATEVAQARRVENTVNLTCLALEQLALRLRTLKELGNLMKEIGPVTKIIRKVSKELSDIAPQVGIELRDVDRSLSSLVFEAGEVARIGEVTPIGEAEKVLHEAELVAEEKLKEKFAIPTPGVSEVEKRR